MAEAEESKEEYYIRLLTFIRGPATEVLQLYFEIKVLNSSDFFMFLENHKHVLFHELYPSIPCCECKTLLLAASKQLRRINKAQFDTLFKTAEGQEVKGHKRQKGRHIKQLCLCSVSAIRTASVDLMDITLLFSVIKSCCQPGSISGQPDWINDIKETRNFIAHTPRMTITKSVFEQKFALVEQSVLNLASVVGPVFEKMIKGQIAIFKNSDLSEIIDKDLKKNSNDSIHQILEIFVKDQKRTLESFANQTRNLVDNAQEIIDSRLQEQKEELIVGIHNVVFEVKTLWKDELFKATGPNQKGLSHDDEVCYVEWTLGTPGNWDVDEIKETLENFSCLMGKFFRIVFVYKGSLIIQTLAQLRFLKRDDEFQVAVKSFLKDFLDICNVDTDTKTIVQIKITISMEKFESKYVVSKNMDTLLSKCDPCSSKKLVLKAIQFCLECQHKLCRECIANHNINAVFLKHQLTDIETLSLENFCTIHKGRIIDFFCVEHDCLCCLSCKTEEHSSCKDLLPLEDAAKDVQHSVMFQDLYNSVSNIRTTLNRAITNQNENTKNLQDNEGAIKSQLASYKAKIIKRLDELEGIFILETRVLKNEQIERTESDRNSLLQIQRLIKRISSKIDQESKDDSQKQIFVLLNTFKLEIIGIENKLQNILPTLMTRRIVFQPQDGIENTITSLGAIRVETCQCVEDYKPHKIQQVQVPSFISQMPSKFRFERKLEIKRSDGAIIRKMCITDDNRLLLSTVNGTNLLVYSDSGDYLQDCQLFGVPWDIAVIPGEDKAVVTIPRQDSIQIIDTKTVSAGSIYPVTFAWGVTIVNDKICVGGLMTVNILDMQGNYLKIVRVPNAGFITNLHSGPDESVYYTDRTCDVIYHFTLEGEERFRYTSVNFNGPNAIATDKKGILYVACEQSSNIQRIRPNGEFQDIILNTENDIYCPTDILFSNDYRKLFVLNHVANNTYGLVFSCS